MVGTFFCALSAFLFSLFWIEPGAPHFNPITQFFSALLKPTLGQVLALLSAALAILSVAALAKFETRMRDEGTRHLQSIHRTGLGFAIGLTWLCYFDFSLPADALHNMTNIGPALHLRFGEVLMVDTFSQYGPGPVLVTLLGLTLGPTTAPMGNIVVQIQSLLFYSLWLVCLYRMSTLKLPSLLIGFLSIGILMAGWGQGEGNVNFAPSIIGPRYLPILLMVLAISFLRPPARHSTLTAVSTMIAGMWSAEALIGSLGIRPRLLGMLGLRDRAIVRILADGILACSPFWRHRHSSSLTLHSRPESFPTIISIWILCRFTACFRRYGRCLPIHCFLAGARYCLRYSWYWPMDGCGFFDRSQQVTELGPAALYYQFCPWRCSPFSCRHILSDARWSM